MILSVCLNPALQKIIVFKDFKLNSVNRGETLYQVASGKGINVARVLKLLGEDVATLCPIGGITGQLIVSLLKKEKIKLYHIPIKDNIRTCITLINSYTMVPKREEQKIVREQTEIIEPSPKVSKSEVKKTLLLFNTLLKRAKILTISGTFPNGYPNDIYLKMVERANEYNIPVIADISGESLKLVLNCFVSQNKTKNEGIYLIKPNLKEFASTYNLPLTTEAIKKKMRELSKVKSFKAVLTNGNKDFFAFANEKIYIVSPPRIKVLNAIGSGDSMTAAFAHCLKEKIPFEESLKFATACGSSNATTLLPGIIIKKQLKKLQREVKIVVD